MKKITLEDVERFLIGHDLMENYIHRGGYDADNTGVLSVNEMVSQKAANVSTLFILCLLK